jgi:hypothetical protein
MRSIRPPPKVTPPKPPSHLFEPREEIVPMRLEKKLAPAASPAPIDFEDDVRRQMAELENELKSLANQDVSSDALAYKPRNPETDFSRDRNMMQPTVPDQGSAVPSGGEDFASSLNQRRVNPNDWKAKGFPSEFAYMKAMGQLEISDKPQQPPPRVNNRNDGYDGRNSYAQSASAAGEYNTGAPPPSNVRLMEKNYERDMVEPARRKGGAIAHLYAEEEATRNKAASQHNYSDQLQRQVCVYALYFYVYLCSTAAMQCLV